MVARVATFVVYQNNHFAKQELTFSDVFFFFFFWGGGGGLIRICLIRSLVLHFRLCFLA